jgi:serine/threonine-protein kinase
LPLPEVASLLGQACKGLAVAHDAGIVHRDLKPANLYLAREGQEEVLKILDFGIARAPATISPGGETEPGSLVGSPNYMSPEQIADGNAVDSRSDLWALGVIAFRCLTGRDAFPGTQIGPVLLAVCSGPIPVPSAVAPELGPQVDWFFQVALARPLQQRFQRAADFARAFHAVAQAVGAAPVSAPFPTFTAVASTQVFPTPVPQATPWSHGGAASASTGKPPASGRLAEGPTALTGSVSPMTHGSQAGRRRTGGVGLVVGVAGAVLVAGGFLLLRPFRRVVSARTEPAVAATPASTAPDEPAVPVVSSVAAVPPSASTPTSPSSVPSPETPAPVEAAGADVPVPVQKPHAPSWSQPRTPGVTPKPNPAPTAPTPPPHPSNCDPNYYFDPAGHKHFKLECF